MLKLFDVLCGCFNFKFLFLGGVGVGVVVLVEICGIVFVDGLFCLFFCFFWWVIFLF